MGTYHVSTRELVPRLRQLGRERRARVITAIRDTLATQGIAIVHGAIGTSRPPPVDRGMYKRSWRAVKIPNGGALLNTTPYGGVIEHGRRPGTMPPTGPIAAWVRRKGLVREVRGRGGQDAAARSIAFAIARKIKERGQPARHILRSALPALRAAVATAIRTAMKG
jgi:hypothetical protein